MTIPTLLFKIFCPALIINAQAFADNGQSPLVREKNDFVAEQARAHKPKKDMFYKDVDVYGRDNKYNRDVRRQEDFPEYQARHRDSIEHITPEAPYNGDNRYRRLFRVSPYKSKDFD